MVSLHLWPPNPDGRRRYSSASLRRISCAAAINTRRFSSGTGLGTRGLTIGGLNIAGITLGTLLALLLNFALSFDAERRPEAG